VSVLEWDSDLALGRAPGVICRANARTERVRAFIAVWGVGEEESLPGRRSQTGLPAQVSGRAGRWRRERNAGRQRPRGYGPDVGLHPAGGGETRLELDAGLGVGNAPVVICGGGGGGKRHPAAIATVTIWVDTPGASGTLAGSARVEGGLTPGNRKASRTLPIADGARLS